MCGGSYSAADAFPDLAHRDPDPSSVNDGNDAEPDIAGQRKSTQQALRPRLVVSIGIAAGDISALLIHFRALVKKHHLSDFELKSHVSPERVSAANNILGDWDGFENYMSTVPKLVNSGRIGVFAPWKKSSASLIESVDTDDAGFALCVEADVVAAEKLVGEEGIGAQERGATGDAE